MVMEGITLAVLIICVVYMMINKASINININHNYPEQNFVEIPDNYDEEGDPKIEDKAVQDFNEALKSIHEFMTDTEE